MTWLLGRGVPPMPEPGGLQSLRAVRLSVAAGMRDRGVSDLLSRD